ncbi:prolyl endopeptidase-like isoform X1 [Pelobates cultripes]|uniref:Prolyl endopeptidase n=1 Tax=Pelobates cultripes TaxID=61616 RepID=A0AAD1RHW9_PELCU|nr:prolyl endopeptidase-like isoform X1 [Pelobates cultripes]
MGVIKTLALFIYRSTMQTKTVTHPLFTSPWRYHNILTGCSTQARYSLFRGFSSWQGLLEWERKHWQKLSGKYRPLSAALKKQLNIMHEKYPNRSERDVIRHGDHVYFEDDGCICRLHVVTGEESLEVLLGPDDFGLPYYQIQQIRISPNHNFLAVTFKGTDWEESTCIILKLGTLPQVTHCLQNVRSFEWVTDNILFHTRQEDLRCHHVYLTDFTNTCATKLVYAEQDSRFFVDIYMTRDKRFLTINSNSKSTSEVWLVDCNHLLETPVLVQQRIPGMIYHIEHKDGFLYILTNHGESSEYKLMKAPVSGHIDDWRLVYETKPEVKIVDMELLKDRCIMFLKCKNRLYFEVISLSTDRVIQSIKLPAWACTFESHHCPEYRTSNFRFYLESPIQEPVLFDYSMLENRLLMDDTYKSTDQVYRTERLQAESKDGNLVPITLFYKSSNEEFRHKPLLIHVYGAYGMDLNMSFKAEKRMLVEDGWLLAYCHVRGGGELGRSWHKEGILDKKQNGLDDLCACITRLHEGGFSQSRYTAIEASSGGGALAGALYNSNPELFKAMVLEAPFLDILNTMMNTSLPLTIEEQEEWGDPVSDHKYREYIRTYCPYQNIKPQNYPSVLITAYENDLRVPLLGLIRYMKKLREAVDSYCKYTNDPVNKRPTILLDLQPGGSHCDSLCWEESLQKVAVHLAFLYKELKIDDRTFVNRKC